MTGLMAYSQVDYVFLRFTAQGFMFAFREGLRLYPIAKVMLFPFLFDKGVYFFMSYQTKGCLDITVYTDNL